MKKLIASVLTLVCILTLARCGKSDSGDYPATIMVNGTNYYSTDHAVPVEMDESVIQYTTSYAENGIPQKDGEANFNRDLGTPYAVIEDDSVVVLIDKITSSLMKSAKRERKYRKRLDTIINTWP